MMEIERPKIETAALSPDGRYGKFVVEPLERGLTAWCMSFPPLRACARMSPRSS